MANAKDEGQTDPKAVSIKPDLTKYVNGVSGAGKKTKRCDDYVAQSLDGFTLEEVYAVASALTETTVKDLNAKYNHLNGGMQRMNLGNRIRGAVTKQDKAREKDNKQASGAKLLDVACADPRRAATARSKAKAAAAKEAAAKADAKAKAEAGKEAKAKAA